MGPRFSVLSFAVLALLAAARILNGQSHPTFSFENNMEGWESDSSMPQSPCYTTAGYPECNGQPNQLVDRRAAIQRTTERAYDGTHSLRIFMDGLGGGGFAWITRAFPATPGGRYRVDVGFYVGPPQGDINAKSILAFAGLSRPSGGQFTLLRPRNATLQGDWARYEFISEVVPDVTGTIWAAVGLGAGEGFANFFFDSVTVTIEPLVTTNTTAVLGMTPSSGTGSSRVFSFTFSDAKGWQDLGVVNILLNDSLTASNACYLAYVPAIDALYLVNDAGNALLSGMLLSGDNTPPGFQVAPIGLSNRQCSVSSGDSVLTASGNTLTLKLAISFSSTFVGGRTFYLAARDVAGGNNTGWQTVGTWSVQ